MDEQQKNERKQSIVIAAANAIEKAQFLVDATDRKLE